MWCNWQHALTMAEGMPQRHQQYQGLQAAAARVVTATLPPPALPLLSAAITGLNHDPTNPTPSVTIPLPPNEWSPVGECLAGCYVRYRHR